MTDVEELPDASSVRARGRYSGRPTAATEVHMETPTTVRFVPTPLNAVGVRVSITLTREPIGLPVCPRFAPAKIS